MTVMLMMMILTLLMMILMLLMMMMMHENCRCTEASFNKKQHFYFKKINPKPKPYLY